jgi:hypothetical protein
MLLIIYMDVSITSPQLDVTIDGTQLGEIRSDGKYKVRTGAHYEGILQIRAEHTGYYSRYTLADGKFILFIKQD